MPEEPPVYDPYAPAPRPAATRPEASPSSMGPTRTSGTATAALVCAVLGFTCFPAVGGLLGVILGLVAKSEISRSEGSRSGSGLALAGIVLGALNVLGSVAGLGLMIWALDSPSSPSAGPPPPPPVVAPPVPTFGPAPAPTASGSGSVTPPTAGGSSRDDGVTVTRVGHVDLVDVGSGVRSLRAELDRQRDAARKDGKKLLVWVVLANCLPCNGVAASLPDPKMQTALGEVRVVRVDGREFSSELTRMGIPVAKVPGFALIGATNTPSDYVDGGEWDEDIPRNIAPVLGSFVRGSYAKRRDPWRGVRRGDETQL